MAKLAIIANRSQLLNIWFYLPKFDLNPRRFAFKLITRLERSTFMELLKTYIPNSYEPVWHLHDPVANTLKSFTPGKKQATEILNRLQKRNKRPRAHPHTYFECLVADTNEENAYSSNTFVYTGAYTDEMKRFFHFIKMSDRSQLQKLQTFEWLRALANEHDVYIGEPKNEARVLEEFEIIEMWLRLANREIGGPLKWWNIWEVEDLIAGFSAYHLSAIGLEQRRHFDHVLISLAARKLNIELGADCKKPYFNRVQNVRRQGLIKLPRKFHGDVVNYMRYWPTRLPQTFHDHFHSRPSKYDEKCMMVVA